MFNMSNKKSSDVYQHCSDTQQNLIIIHMFSVYVIVFECVIIIFFGAFVRLDTATLTSIDYFGGSLVFLLGFAMLSVAKKLMSWTSIGNLLILLAVNFQWNLLWFQFWQSCFNGFSINFTVSSSLLINCISCTLCCLLSFTDFLGKINWRQLLIISLIQSIGFSLNSAVITYGIKAFDGGGGIQIFFLSGLYSYSMWIIGFKFKEIPLLKAKFTYSGITFGLIGLLLVLYGWPSFNAGGVLFSQSVANSDAQSIMASCAYINTIFTLSAAVISAFIFYTPSEKMKAIINGGIIMASSTDVLLNPAGGLVLGCVASATTVTLLKFFSKLYIFESLSSSTFKLGFGLLSGIFASIIVASRNGLSPTLTDNLLVKGAYDLAALAVTLGIGILVGVCCGLIVKYIPGPGKEDMNNDTLLWDIKDESLPVYPHDQVFKQVLNSNRLDNQLIPFNNNASRIPTFVRPNNQDSSRDQHKRDIDYVPPPKPPSPPNPHNSHLHNIKFSTSSKQNLIASTLKDSKQDITRPQTNMKVHVNRIDQQEQQEKEDRKSNTKYWSQNSNINSSDVKKKLDLDEGAITGEGGAYIPN